MEIFFAQGGYAFYVWSSYGMALVVLIWELVQLGRRRRALLARLARLVRGPTGRGSDRTQATDR